MGRTACLPNFEDFAKGIIYESAEVLDTLGTLL